MSFNRSHASSEITIPASKDLMFQATKVILATPYFDPLAIHLRGNWWDWGNRRAIRHHYHGMFCLPDRGFPLP
jgi:hypothetical protein